MPPAARLTDMHECPMEDPAVPPIPHMGGRISGPGEPTVLIRGLPAARLGDKLICVGATDEITSGSSTVMIGDSPAARMGDKTLHGGQIVSGDNTVWVGN